jgi:hypothetical protein
MGFYDTWGPPTDNRNGAFIIIDETTLQGQGDDAGGGGGIVNTATTYAITQAVWYRAVIKIDDPPAMVYFYLYSAAGALLWSDFVDLSGHDVSWVGPLGHGVCAQSDSPAGVTEILSLDYVDYVSGILVR